MAIAVNIARLQQLKTDGSVILFTFCKFVSLNINLYLQYKWRDACDLIIL